MSPKFEEQNGSKALVQGEKDGVAYIYNLSDYVKMFYKYPTLSNMNLGLIGSEKADYEVTQNIAYVKAVINGYTYTYEYGGTGNSVKTAAPTVNWQNGYAYTRAIYPSDIVYNSTDAANNLKIYVVYRININNTNMMNYGKKKSETTSQVSYVEVDLSVTSLTNTFDTSRYELETEYNKTLYGGDFKNWKVSGEGVASYTGDKLKDGIVPNKPKTVYIQFKVKDNAINKLLTEQESYEKNPTIATVQAKHNYWKAYYTYPDGIDKQPKLVFKNCQTNSIEKTATSYYLRLKLNTERIITGTVFEDENISTNGEHLGNSMFDSTENRISNVTVELFTESGKEAILYSSSNNYAEKEAKTKTKTDGTYSFVGITPGKYYVRFTYGDGTQKIIKPDGTEEGNVLIENYKSTIVSEPCIRRVLGYDDGVKASQEWYKHTSGCTKPTSYSTAVDNVSQRVEYNANKSSRTTIDASTGLMSIGLENTEKNIASVTSTFEDGIQKETILGINFGIIKLPEVSLALDKVISNIQIINSQGNLIVDGNPSTKNIKYVSNLDELNHTMVKGSQYIKSEINEDELYGSTLKLEYSITVQNNSEVNYYEGVDLNNKYYGYYYKFGVHDNKYASKEVTITVDSILDFMDPSIKYDNISIDDKHKMNQVKVSDNKVLADNIQAKTNLVYEYLIEIDNWQPLFTTKNKDKNYGKDKTEDTAELSVTRMLAVEDDLAVSNVAQVKKLHVTDNPETVQTIDTSVFNDPVYTNPTKEVYVTITPPTGQDRITTIIYVIVEIIGLSIITVGIVFIKKKVLNK